MRNNIVFPPKKILKNGILRLYEMSGVFKKSELGFFREITAKDFDLKELIDENDEILRYQNLRYIGPVEACCRIFEQNLCYRYPAVIKLELHLENQHKVLFDPKENLDNKK